MAMAVKVSVEIMVPKHCVCISSLSAGVWRDPYFGTWAGGPLASLDS